MLTATQLIGFDTVSNRLPRIEYVTSTSDTVDRTTYTFSSQSLGTATSDRIILIGPLSRSSSTSQCNSVTVGGTSATQITRTTGSQNTSSIWAIQYPTGTSADVVVTFNTGQARAAIGIWALYNKSSVTANASSSSADNSSGSITAACAINGVALGIAFESGDSGMTEKTPTLTNLTKDFTTLYTDSTVYTWIYGVSGNDTSTSNASFSINWQAFNSVYANSASVATWKPD